MAAGTNPVGYSDLFNFADRTEIVQAIADIRQLRQTYNEFTKDVTGRQVGEINIQMGQFAEEIKKVAAATSNLNATNEKSQAALIANLKLIEQLRAENDALKASKKASKEFEDELAFSVDNLTKKLSEQVKAYRKIDQSTEAGDASAKRLAESIRRTKIEIAGLNEATKTTTTIFNAAKASYNELDAQTKKLVIQYRNLSDVEGKNAATAKNLTDQIFANTAALKNMDAQMNQNFRNVGNYKSAFNGLGNSINQLTREAPAFAVSLNTGFLALSNNIPILADEISKLSARNKELAASGQPTQSIFKQLIGSIFSFQTALSVGVLLLTLFGGKIANFISGLFGAGKAIDLVKEKQAALNKLFADANKDASSQIASLNLLYKAATDANLPLNDRIRAVKQLKEEFPDYFSKIDNEIILNGKSQKAYEALTKSIIDSSRAKAAKSQLDALADQRLQAEFQKLKIKSKTDEEAAAVKPFTISTGQGTGGGGGSVVGSGGVSASTTQTVTVAEQLIPITKRRTDALREQDKILANITAKEKFLINFVGIKNLITNEETDDKKPKEKTDKQRLAELEAARKRMDELIQASAKYQISQEELKFAKSSKTAQDEINLENNKLKILEESYRLRLNLYKKDGKEYKEILTEKAKAEADNIDKVLQIRDKDAQATTKNLLAQADLAFSKTKQQYTDELYYEEEKLKILEAGFDARLKLYKTDSDEYKAILAQKAEAEAKNLERINRIREQQGKARQAAEQSSDDLTDTITGAAIRTGVSKKKISPAEGERLLHLQRVTNIQEEIKKNEEKLGKLKDGDADYFETLRDLNNQKAKLVDENANYEIAKAEEVAAKKKELQQAVLDFVIEAGTQAFELGRDLNENNIAKLERDKDKELALAGNNADAKAKIEENYNKKLAALKRKQAIFDKVQALVNVGINTAVAVSKAIAEFPITGGLPFSAIAIAQGAIQAAVILAKPIPNYFKGRNGGPKEVAEINEQGPELLEKNGRFRFANAGRRGLSLLEQGETVHTASATKNIIDSALKGADSKDFMDSLLYGTGIIRSHERSKEDRMFAAIASHGLNRESIETAFTKSLERMPWHSLEIDENGMHKFARSMSGKTELMNSRNKLGGNG